MSPLTPPFNSVEPAPADHCLASELPLLDPSVLRDLKDQVRAPLVRDFVRDYVALWDYRQRRLSAALAEPEGRGEALDAAISLKVSSAMVGALRLAFLAGTLEGQIRELTFPAGKDALAKITSCGQATIRELRKQHPEAG